jgi:ecotin
METDGCNQYNLNGKLDKKTVKSYLDYYNFTTNGNVASTNMGCLNAKPENKFVSSQPLLLDYNSNLPIVIYTPKGYSVQYKIFTADNTTYQAQTVNNF